MEIGKSRMEQVELHDNERQRAEPYCDTGDHRWYGKKPANERVNEIEEPLRIDAFEAERKNVREGSQPLLPLTLIAALNELLPLTRRIGNHQAAAVQHPNELLQLFCADGLRRKVAFESIGDLIETRLAIEHLQDGVLLLFEAEVLQANGVFNDPIDSPLVPLAARFQVRPHANWQLAGGAGYETISKRSHS